MNHLLEDPGGYPPLDLLVDGLPRREVVGHHAPWRAGPHDPPQGVKDLSEVVDALRGVLADQRQVGSDEGPFFVRNVRGIGLSVRHSRMLPPSVPRVHNTL